jgi:hypothetical protein
VHVRSTFDGIGNGNHANPLDVGLGGLMQACGCELIERVVIDFPIRKIASDHQL